MEVAFWLGVFIVSIMVLLKSSDFFIALSEKVSLSLGIAPFIIGVTIVALGTSLPELVTSIAAVLSNKTEIVVSNVVGSNIANTLLVMGSMAVFGRRINLSYKLNLFDALALLGSAVFLAIAIYDRQFGLAEAILCLTFLVIYVVYMVWSGQDDLPDGETKPKLDWYVFPALLLSVVFIWFSADYNVEAIIKLAELFNIGTEVITLSAVALGTSLPELFVSVTAIRRGNADIAVGNILGSNVFNIFAVMGIPSLFGTLAISEVIVSFSLPIMLLGTVLYYIIVLSKKIRLWQGVILLFAYISFLVVLYT